MNPQRPGDVLVFEEYVYLVVPTRPTDPPNYVEAVRWGEPVLNDVRPYASLRMASGDLVRAESPNQFAQAAHRNALEHIRRFAGESAHLRRLPEAIVALTGTVKALLTNRTVWYAADRLIANPARVGLTIGG